MNLMNKLCFSILLILSFLTAGCKFLFIDHSPKEIEVSGSLSTSQENNNSARTAFPEITLNQDYSYYVHAVMENDSTKTKDGTVSIDEKKYSIVLSDGIWIVTVYAEDSLSKRVLTGSTKITITDGALDSSSTTIILDGCLDSSFGQGKITLKVAVDSDTNIESAYVTWGNNAASEKTLNFNLSNSYKDTLDVNLNPGTYQIHFVFYNNDGQTVYSFVETINVYANLTTNKWKTNSASPYIASGNIKITKSMVDSFRNTVFYIDQIYGDNTATGGFFDPFKSIETALQIINQINDEMTTYKIYLKSDYSADNSGSDSKVATDYGVDAGAGNTYINISSNSPLKLKLLSLGTNAKSINGNGISGNNRVIFAGEKVNLTLENIVITGGNISTQDGGGIYCRGNLVIGEGVEISGNSAKNGGGIAVIASTDNASISVIGGEISGNTATSGNGIFVESSTNAYSSTISIGGNAKISDEIYLGSAYGALKNNFIDLLSDLSSHSVASKVKVVLKNKELSQLVLRAASSAVYNNNIEKFDFNLLSDFELIRNNANEALLLGPLNVYVCGINATNLSLGSEKTGGISKPFETVQEAIDFAENCYGVEVTAGIVNHKQIKIYLDGENSNVTVSTEANNYSQVTVGSSKPCNVLIQGYGTNGGELIANGNLTNTRNLYISDDNPSTVVLGKDLKLTSGFIDTSISLYGNSIYVGKTSTLKLEDNVSISSNIFLPADGTNVQKTIAAENLQNSVNVSLSTYVAGTKVLSNDSLTEYSKIKIAGCFGTLTNNLTVNSNGELSGSIPTPEYLKSNLPAELHVNSQAAGKSDALRVVSAPFNQWYKSTDNTTWTKLDNETTYFYRFNIESGTTYYKVKRTDEFYSSSESVCKILCNNDFDKIGNIYYLDKTYSSDYNAAKVPVGIVVDVDAFGEPSKIVYLNEANRKWALTSAEGANHDLSALSEENGSGSYDLLKTKVTDAGTLSNYPVFEYCEDAPGADWYLPANHELDQLSLNSTVINTALGKIGAGKATSLTESGSWFYWSSTNRTEYKAYSRRMGYYLAYNDKTVEVTAGTPIQTYVVRPFALVSTVKNDIGNLTPGDVYENITSNISISTVFTKSDTKINFTISGGDNSKLGNVNFTFWSKGKDITFEGAAYWDIDITNKKVIVKKGIPEGTDLSLKVSYSYKGIQGYEDEFKLTVMDCVPATPDNFESRILSADALDLEEVCIKVSGTPDYKKLINSINKTSVKVYVDLSETNLTSIEGTVTQECPYLAGIVLPDTLTILGDYTFSYCTALKEVIVPDTVTSIGSSAFNMATNLLTVHLPSALQEIGNFAFKNCTKISEITIPGGVDTIKSYAFLGCSGLTDLIFEKTDNWYYTTESTKPTDFSTATAVSSTSLSDKTMACSFVVANQGDNFYRKSE